MSKIDTLLINCPFFQYFREFISVLQGILFYYAQLPAAGVRWTPTEYREKIGTRKKQKPKLKRK